MSASDPQLDDLPPPSLEVELAGQAEIVAALADPGTWTELLGHRPERVETESTHISHVFLAGDRAVKLKRAVRFSFLDFATRERRRVACIDELRLNRRSCPDVYLAVRPLLRDTTGRIHFGPPAEMESGREALDYVVEMRRLPAAGMLTGLLARNEIAADELAAFGRELADFHANCASDGEVTRWATPAALGDRWRREVAETDALVTRLCSRGEETILREFGPCFLQDHAELVESRPQAGRIREGHGDLHAGNLCRLEPRPGETRGRLCAFDCIEFSTELRCNDVASEVAFLAMDLERRDRADLATAFVDAYVAATSDSNLVRLLPFYGCYRAVVRAKVEALAAPASDSPAPLVRRALALAIRDTFRGAPPRAVLIGGRSGSGKTHVAHGIAVRTGWAHLSSDALRKAGALRPRYDTAARRQIYERLLARGREILQGGESVIIDATFLRGDDRALARGELTSASGLAPLLLWCEASPETTRERLVARAGAASVASAADDELAHLERLSDATWETWIQQARDEDRPSAEDASTVWLSTEDAPNEVVGAALLRLWRATAGAVT